MRNCVKPARRGKWNSPVNSIYACALVVAAQQEEVLRIFDFVREQQADGLQRLLSTIYIIAQEQVVWLGRKASVLEQSQQVVILPVDVACDKKYFAIRFHTSITHRFITHRKSSVELRVRGEWAVTGRFRGTSSRDRGFPIRWAERSFRVWSRELKINDWSMSAMVEKKEKCHGKEKWKSGPGRWFLRSYFRDFSQHSAHLRTSSALAEYSIAQHTTINTF